MSGPGTILETGRTIERMVDMPEVKRFTSPRAAIEQVQADLEEFRQKNNLEQVVVINVASTEPPFETTDEHIRLERLQPVLDRPAASPAGEQHLCICGSGSGLPYVNFTPSLGSSLPGNRRTGPVAQDTLSAVKTAKPAKRC